MDLLVSSLNLNHPSLCIPFHPRRQWNYQSQPLREKKKETKVKLSKVKLFSLNVVLIFNTRFGDYSSNVDQLLPLQKILYYNIRKMIWNPLGPSNKIHVLYWSKAIKTVGVLLFLNYIGNRWDVNRWVNEFSRAFQTVLCENMLDNILSSRIHDLHRKQNLNFNLKSSTLSLKLAWIYHLKSVWYNILSAVLATQNSIQNRNPS